MRARALRSKRRGTSPAAVDSRRGDRAAFTLVELLIAALLAAMVAAGFFQALRASARRYRAGESGLEATGETQRILELIRRDIEGPWPWSPCNYPMKVLRKLGYARGNRIAFATEWRELTHWFTYYRKAGRSSVGPVRDPEEHVARPVRAADPLAPCKVSWECCKGRPYWVKDVPSPAKFTECLKTTPPWVDGVALDLPRTAGIWILGPAIWSYDAERQVLVRWTEAGGFHELGLGRLKSFELQAIKEWSMIEYTEPTHFWAPVPVKELLRVEIAMERDADRPDLEVVTLITRLDPSSS